MKGLKVKCELCKTEKTAFATEVSAELWVCQVCTINQREEPIDETGTSTHSGAVPVEVPWHFSSDHMMHPAETNYTEEPVEIHQRIAAIDGNKFVNEDFVYSEENLDKIIALRNLKGNDVIALREPTDYKHKNYHVKWSSTWTRHLAEYQDIAEKKGADAANAFDATTKCRTMLMRINRMLNILVRRTPLRMAYRYLQRTYTASS